MRNKYIILPLFFILVLFLECSPRLINYNRQVKRLNNDEITRDEFDKKFFKLYSEDKKYVETDPNFSIKFKGCYVTFNHRGYKIYKFYPNGKMIEKYEMDDYPNNISLLLASTSSSYFSLTNSTLSVEYLMSRDWNLYNIIKMGTVKNDSIVFYQTKGTSLFSNTVKINEVYVYDENLTVDLN